MPVFAFELSMPNNNSWNGKWSGDGVYYARTRTVPKAEADDLSGYYHYNFDDGWAAGVTVRHVDGREAAKVRKNTRGFCGYEWMIDSILKHRKIQVEETGR